MIRRIFTYPARHSVLTAFLLLNFPAAGLLKAQNTAVASGAWSVCSTWGSPAAIYRNTTDTKTVNSGITVTADANWSTAALILNGTGAVAYNSGIFTDFVSDQGDDVSCDRVYAALQSAGCASCTAYTSASAGQYIRISEAEYSAVRSQLSAVTVAGANDTQFNTNAGTAGGPQTVSITTGQTKAPASSYIVAFGIQYTYTALGTGSIRIKYNTGSGATSGYADYGFGNFGTFPGNSGKYYFVIKTPSETTYNGGPSYLAYYTNVAGINVTHNEDNWVSYNDANTLSSYYGHGTAFQVVTTTVKQW